MNKDNQSAPWNNHTETIKIVLLADCEVEPFIPLLRSLFRQSHFAAEIFVAFLDWPELSCFHPASALFTLKPDLIIVLNSVLSLRDQYYQHAGYPAEFLYEHRLRMTRVWSYIRESSPALVIQANFADPVERIYELYSLQLNSSLPRIVARLNGFISLQIESRDHIRLLDIQQIAAAAGLHKWYAEAATDSNKVFCAPEFLALVARHIIDIFISKHNAGLECVSLAQDELVSDFLIE